MKSETEKLRAALELIDKTATEYIDAIDALTATKDAKKISWRASMAGAMAHLRDIANDAL